MKNERRRETSSMTVGILMSHRGMVFPQPRWKTAGECICVGKTGVQFWAWECEIPINIQVKVLSTMGYIGLYFRRGASLQTNNWGSSAYRFLTFHYGKFQT